MIWNRISANLSNDAARESGSRRKENPEIRFYRYERLQICRCVGKVGYAEGRLPVLTAGEVAGSELSVFAEPRFACMLPASIVAMRRTRSLSFQAPSTNGALPV